MIASDLPSDLASPVPFTSSTYFDSGETSTDSIEPPSICDLVNASVVPLRTVDGHSANFDPLHSGDI